MKKLFTLFIAAMALGFAANAQDSCTVNTSNTQFGISPNDTTAPAIIRDVTFDTVAQVYVPASYSMTIMNFPVTIAINWIVIDTVTGFPTGINYGLYPSSPDTIYGGGRKCIRLNGITSDTVGIYQLTFTGYVNFTAPVVGTETYTIHQLDSLSQANGQGQAFGYFLTVDGGVGINAIGSNFNSSLNIYPNPTSGKFDLTLSNVDKINGDINVYDMIGRKVYTQKMEATGFYSSSIDLSTFAKGLYTVQVRTEKGVAAKNISVE